CGRECDRGIGNCSHEQVPAIPLQERPATTPTSTLVLLAYPLPITGAYQRRPRHAATGSLEPVSGLRTCIKSVRAAADTLCGVDELQSAHDNPRGQKTEIHATFLGPPL